MSALLPIDTVELNLNAEYGYTTREFSKVPRVYVSDNYNSCLVLAYSQIGNIENRKSEYRNHFTLFRNDKSIIIARTETTFVHADNDAIITYDIISPIEKYRSTFKNWVVSFDKISYSSAQPASFVGYSLVCSGEWWFYDNGIILNGTSGYKHGSMCLSMLIYYELHVDHKITISSNDALISMPPTIEVVLKLGNTSSESVTISKPTHASTSTTTTPPMTNSNIESQTVTDTSDYLTRLKPPPTFNLSSIPSTLLPSINATVRPFIGQNENTKSKNVVNKSVIPSLYWFNARCSELCRGNIEYFKPKDFKCYKKL